LPVKAGIADTVKARQLLQHISFFTNRFGAYISGIERPDDTSIDEGSFAERRADTGFNYNQAVMPAATASLAIAECRYGSPDTALQYIHRILASFGYATPGTTYEVSPDFGMFVQAWNITGINIPLIRYFFGIDPDAWHKRVYVHPAFPSQWNEADLQRLLIGDNMVSMHYEQKNGRPVFQLKCTRPGWQIHFAVPGAMAAWVNGKPAKVQAGAVIMTGRWNTIELRP
jgi:hypothetical protein